MYRAIVLAETGMHAHIQYYEESASNVTIAQRISSISSISVLRCVVCACTIGIAVYMTMSMP